MQVKRSTQETVYPETPSLGGVLALSNCDQIMPRFYAPLLFFFKDQMPALETYSLLRRSLAETLSSFYPLAGRYREKNASGELEIICNDEGALLHETWVDCGFDDFLPNVDPHPDFHLLAPQLDFDVADITKLPLLSAQITHFECGRICLGVRIHHTVCDGTSTTDFLSCWAILARAKAGRGLNGKGPQPGPYLDRSLLKANNPPSLIEEHLEYQNHLPAWDPCITTKIFSFTPSAVEELRVRAARCDQGSSHFTRFEALATHLWRGVTYAKGLTPDQEVRLAVAVDGRKRFNPPLPKNYFGNAVFFGYAVSKAGELVESSSAGVVKAALAKVNDAYMRSVLDWVSMQAPVKSVCLALTSSIDIAMTSWWRLPFYELDFGWGNPSHVRTLLPTDEWLVLLPSPLGPGHVDALVALNSDHMPIFEHYINSVWSVISRCRL